MTISLTVIKKISTEKFEIGLYETSRGEYVISYEVLGKTVGSNKFKDFNNASHFFLSTLQELQGQ